MEKGLFGVGTGGKPYKDYYSRERDQETAPIEKQEPHSEKIEKSPPDQPLISKQENLMAPGFEKRIALLNKKTQLDMFKQNNITHDFNTAVQLSMRKPQLPIYDDEALSFIHDYRAPAEDHWPPDNGSDDYPKVLPVDSIKWIENFRKTASKKYGADAFRRHVQPPQSFLDSHNFLSKREIIGRAWAAVREDLGYQGDCRHEWEKLADEASLADLIEKRFDLDIQNWPEGNEEADALRARLAAVLPAGINALATRLDSGDMHAIRVWGKDIDAVRTQVLKQTHGDNIREVASETSEIKAILKDYESLLRAKPPTGLRGVFFSVGNLLNMMSPFYVKQVDYRLFSATDKMQRGEEILQKLEDAYNEQIDVQEGRALFAENAQRTAHSYSDILEDYESALKKNRTRLIVDGQHVAERGVSRVQDTVDTRIRELERSVSACAREELHYIACAALYDEVRARMREVVDVTIEAYRTQMRAAYLNAVGQQVFMTDSVAKSLGAVMLDKTRSAKLAEDLDALADRVRDLSGLQEKMDMNEQLVLEYKQPLALEHHRVLALPAPDYSHEPVAE